MNPAKFWQVVSRHKWIPTVILWESFDLERWDPSIMGYAFLPDTIEREYECIAFRPWHTLELTSIDSGVEVKVGSESAGEKVRHVVFYHLHGEFEFTRHTLIGDGSVEETLLSIDSRAVIDAVVRISTVSVNAKPDFSNAKTSKGIVDALVANFENNVKERYEIFRPSHTSGHEVTE
ncbi:MAG TPA: hypothetical protein PLF31_02910 [Candidatus Paceibacterota bacterium]|nr:hypothetical protein [Candidatus Paceibacterota bacterium]